MANTAAGGPACFLFITFRVLFSLHLQVLFPISLTGLEGTYLWADHEVSPPSHPNRLPASRCSSDCRTSGDGVDRWSCEIFPDWPPGAIKGHARRAITGWRARVLRWMDASLGGELPPLISPVRPGLYWSTDKNPGLLVSTVVF